MSSTAFAENVIVSAGTEHLSSKLGDDLVILDLKSGVYFGLNPVGARVWELAQQRKTAGDIRDAIAREFDVEPADFEHDLTLLLRQMEAQGLVHVQPGASNAN